MALPPRATLGGKHPRSRDEGRPRLSGHEAERAVFARLRAALPPDYRLYPNVRFAAKTRPTGPAHDGETDLVVVHPDNGILVLEVKAGEPSRDAAGRWYTGTRELPRSPFEQAEAAKHDLVRAIRDLPDWPPDLEPRAGHAVAFPDVDLASLPRGHVLLGPDAPPDIVLDADALAADATDNAARAAVERAYAWWVGDGSRGRPIAPHGVDLIHEYLAPTVDLRRLLRHDVAETRERLLRASRSQLLVLNQARHLRRVEVVGPAGSGKSLVAVEKARRLAREGFRTLFVCFNQPLATAVQHDLVAVEPDPARHPTVSTFHRLCETLGQRAGTLPPKPATPPREWWEETLPGALDAAIDRLPDERYHAIVVDEGQDFEPGWFASLEFLFRTPADGVLWVFHDPGQALYRDDRVGELGLEKLDLFEDWRSPGPVAELAARFYRGPTEPIPMGDEGGRAPTVLEAEPGRPTIEAVRRELHRLLVEEGVRAWQIVVLSGRSAAESEVWRQRRFGNVELWNGAIDDAGHSLGLPSDRVPDEPPDGTCVRFETVRRFKGLEREVVVLCELPTEGDRLDALLYTALTRATTQLVVVAPAALAPRLEGAAATRPGPRQP